MAYLSAPLWALFLVIGAIIALQGQTMPIDYFPDPYSLFPTWPVIDSDRALNLLAITAGVLLAPKLAGLAVLVQTDPMARRWGGWSRLLPAILAETLLSALVAPILMVHQCLSVGSVLVGRDGGWKPLRRAPGTAIPLAAFARFHAVETVIGMAMLIAIALGVLTPLLVPIAASLAFAVPLSILMSMRPEGWFQDFAATPLHRNPTNILRLRERCRSALDGALGQPPVSAPQAEPDIPAGEIAEPLGVPAAAQ